jgi:hypothetical protein
VAILALGTVTTIVYVVEVVAGVAVLGNVFVLLVEVTAAAKDVLVLAFEREVRLAMVIIEFFPRLGQVTIAALFAEVALVRILLAVAAVAISCCLGVLLVLLVAGGTGDLGMAAFKSEIGYAMVECCAVEKHDRCVPADVVSVTGFAWLFLESRCAAVEAGARGYVGVNVLVTVKAQPILRFLFKASMTTRALGLVLGMPGYQFAWHQQGLDFSRLRSGHHNQTHDSNEKDFDN